MRYLVVILVAAVFVLTGCDMELGGGLGDNKVTFDIDGVKKGITLRNGITDLGDIPVVVRDVSSGSYALVAYGPSSDGGTLTRVTEATSPDSLILYFGDTEGVYFIDGTSSQAEYDGNIWYGVSTPSAGSHRLTIDSGELTVGSRVEGTFTLMADDGIDGEIAVTGSFSALLIELDSSAGDS